MRTTVGKDYGTRKFAGKLYKLVYIVETKAKILKARDTWKKHGYSTHVAKYPHGYLLYVRKA